MRCGLEFNEWMKALDTRYHSKHKDAPVRNRIEGSISTCNPPQGAPNWAVVDNWHGKGYVYKSTTCNLQCNNGAIIFLFVLNFKVAWVVA